MQSDTPYLDAMDTEQIYQWFTLSSYLYSVTLKMTLFTLYDAIGRSNA